MNMDMTNPMDGLVLGTVNAPWKRSIDAVGLTRAITEQQTDAWLVHLATFFTEVRCGLILSFARAHNIGLSSLSAAYSCIKDATGESNAMLEAEFVRLGLSA